MGISWVVVVLMGMGMFWLLYYLDGECYKNQLLEKSQSHGMIFVKDEPLVVLKEEEYNTLLFSKWDEQLTPSLRKVLADIVRERKRQDVIYPNSPDNLPMLIVVLTEEVGECAQAVQADYEWSKDSDSGNLYEEFIQASAVSAKGAEFVVKRDELI